MCRFNRYMMVTVETVSIVFTALSISLAAFYYINTLRNTQRNQQLAMETRKAQHYIQMLQTVSTDEFLRRTLELLSIEFRDYDDFYEMTTDYESETGAKFSAYTTWLNGFGHMLKEGLIDREMISNFGQGIQYIRAWDSWRPYILEYRERRNLPLYMSGLEYLAEEMKAFRVERGWPSEWSTERSTFVGG
jgi:hypothetical protein